MMNYITSFFKSTTEVEKEIEKDKVKVIWIHGANQSSLSFSFLRNYCKFTNEEVLNYTSMDRFYSNLEKMIDTLKNTGPCFIIGHSLGGLYALHLTEHIPALGAVSLSTPFKGSATADWAKFVVPSYPLFRDVGRRAPAVVAGHRINITIPWTQIVSTTGGVPYHAGPNDGVCTICEMTHRKDMEIIKVPTTHYEVVCSEEVGNIILEKYEDIRKNV